jgi:hypothetical protein
MHPTERAGQSCAGKNSQFAQTHVSLGPLKSRVKPRNDSATPFRNLPFNPRIAVSDWVGGGSKAHFFVQLTCL